MENKNYSTVFEADLAYLRSLGDTSECATEFEVRLKTLRKLGGDIQSTTPLLFEIEKKILDFLGGDSSLYNNIYFLRKAIAEKQGVNTEGLHTIYAIAVASLNSKPVAIDNYVTFTAEQANSTIGLTKLSTNQTLEYSADTTNWNTMNTTTNISLPNVGDKVYVRGILSADNSNSNYTQFKMTGKIAASGNCNAIWNHEDLEAPLKKNCGYYMFRSCTSLVTAPELPATTLTTGCYNGMFYGCSALTKAPELPATTLSSYCYSSMFGSCTSLTKTPELPATELAESCYSSMFSSCKALTTAPELPATTLARACFESMFNGCKALTTAPELPATTLANSCYSDMFNGCTSLTTAPELPATTLKFKCYSSMFSRCTSLVEAPTLPATTLESNCYGYMFYGCSKLNKITCLATDISASSCVDSWLSNVSTTGTFIKDPNMNNWTTGVYGIPENWTVKNLELPYVTFTAEEANSTIGLAKLSTNQTLEYSTDTTNWNTMNTSTTITLANTGDKAYIRGILSADNSNSNYTQFNMTGKIAASGNCNAIWNHEDLEAPLKDYCGNEMFRDCTSLTTAPELPATWLSYYGCYQYMFNGCKALTTAPELPATTLKSNCYYSMFEGCTSLTTAPELPATTLSDNCYKRMFKQCTSLVTAPELPATLDKYSGSCYEEMFRDCTSLTTAPELPATTLSNSCYWQMFRDCTSLTTAPSILPATTLESNCYYSMFDGCTSLTTAPELPATELNDGCYQRMFEGCTSLTTAPELPATELAYGCYKNMFVQSGLEKSPILPAKTLTPYCYDSMFVGCQFLSEITCLATDISADGCTQSWLEGTAGEGTFIKDPNMEWSRGSGAIPIGWTVEDYVG